MKVYIVCDLEGVAGVIDHRQQCWFDGQYYEQARRLATLELNAAVEGALAGGANEVVAWDGHGPFPGGIDVELLHPGCRLIMGAGGGGPVGLDSSYSALFQCGLHAMAGTAQAIMGHGGGWQLNGTPLGEIGMNCVLAGYRGVPCVLVTGDQAAAEEARVLVPDIEVAVVKEALSPAVSGLAQAPAISLSPERARAVIQEAAAQAMARIDQVPPLTFDPPYIFRWQFEDNKAADQIVAGHPETIRVDPRTLEFRSDDFADIVRVVGGTS